MYTLPAARSLLDHHLDFDSYFPESTQCEVAQQVGNATIRREADALKSSARSNAEKPIPYSSHFFVGSRQSGGSFETTDSRCRHHFSVPM